MNVFYDLISDGIEAAISAIVGLAMRVALLLLGATLGLGFFTLLYSAPTIDAVLQADLKFFFFAIALGYSLGSFRVQKSYMGIYAYAVLGFTISTATLIAVAYFLFGNYGDEAIAFTSVFLGIAVICYIVHHTDKSGKLT